MAWSKGDRVQLWLPKGEQVGTNQYLHLLAAKLVTTPLNGQAVVDLDNGGGTVVVPEAWLDPLPQWRR